MQYFFKRVLRLSAEPKVVALGFAAGAFASCTPFIGLHFILAFALAFVIGGNLIASALGTSIGNPLTFPFIWATTYKIGSYILGSEPQKSPNQLDDLATGPSTYSVEGFQSFFDSYLPYLQPMLVGSIPLGIVVALLTYFMTHQAVLRYQLHRQNVILAKAEMSRSVNDNKKGSPKPDGSKAFKENQKRS
jgi:uncharacterized protein (DUF2062 family)